MKTKNTENPVLIEAMRYIHNAKEILATKTKSVYDIYEDKKYVKMAGHTAYTGVLYALDKANVLPPFKKSQRPDVKHYQEALSKNNKKMLGYFNGCYEQLHLVAGYDGYGHKRHLQLAFSDAIALIEWASNRAD